MTDSKLGFPKMWNLNKERMSDVPFPEHLQETKNPVLSNIQQNKENVTGGAALTLEYEGEENNIPAASTPRNAMPKTIPLPTTTPEATIPEDAKKSEDKEKKDSMGFLALEAQKTSFGQMRGGGSDHLSIGDRFSKRYGKRHGSEALLQIHVDKRTKTSRSSTPSVQSSPSKNLALQPSPCGQYSDATVRSSSYEIDMADSLDICNFICNQEDWAFVGVDEALRARCVLESSDFSDSNDDDGDDPCEPLLHNWNLITADDLSCLELPGDEASEFLSYMRGGAGIPKYRWGSFLRACKKRWDKLKKGKIAPTIINEDGGNHNVHSGDNYKAELVTQSENGLSELKTRSASPDPDGSTPPLTTSTLHGHLEGNHTADTRIPPLPFQEEPGGKSRNLSAYPGGEELAPIEYEGPLEVPEPTQWLSDSSLLQKAAIPSKRRDFDLEPLESIGTVLSGEATTSLFAKEDRLTIPDLNQLNPETSLAKSKALAASVPVKPNCTSVPGNESLPEADTEASDNPFPGFVAASNQEGRFLACGSSVIDKILKQSEVYTRKHDHSFYPDDAEEADDERPSERKKWDRSAKPKRGILKQSSSPPDVYPVP